MYALITPSYNHCYDYFIINVVSFILTIPEEDFIN